MGSLVVCWVLFPVVLGALSLGCGCALELACDRRVADGIVIPLGYAALMALGCLPLLFSALATLIVPLVVAVAVAGLALGTPWRGRALRWPLVVGAVALFVHGAPVILSGHPAILGYFKLDDAASSMAFVDRLMQHGRDFSGLAPSTYEATLNELFKGYPAGPLMPIGIGHVLVRQDVVWLFQPSLAFAGAMLAMAFWAMLGPLVADTRRRALVVVLAAQPALLIGYAWWGGIKELATASLVATAAVLAGDAMRRPPTVRSLLPIAVTLVAVLDVVSMGGVVWALPPLVPLAVLGFVRGRGTAGAWVREHGRQLAVAAAVLVALALPALTTFNTFRHFGSQSFSGAHAEEVARLFGRLNVLKGFGIWPSGDFRTASVDSGLTHLLIAVVAIAAAAGIAWAWRSRSWELLSYAFASAASAVLLNVAAGPWIAAKALAVASPAAPLLALAAVAIAYDRGWRLEAGLVGAAIVAGLVWSNLLQYHGAQLTPHAQFGELAYLGDRAAGQGPTLMTEYSPYGARHFLRRADGEAASELRRRTVTLRTGGLPLRGTAPDVDEIALGDLTIYRSLVLRRSGILSRPPAPYRLVWQGRYFELWQRPPDDSSLLAHVPLGGGGDPAAQPSCKQVLAVARTPGAARVAAVERDTPLTLSLSSLPLPAGWSGDQGAVVPRKGGVLRVPVQLPHAGRYTVWVGGSWRARLTVSVDGRRLRSVRHELNEFAGSDDMGSARLAAGSHTIALDYSGPDLHPGSGGTPFALGPVVVGDETADRPVLSVAPSRARSLCGRRLDWIEALSR